MWDKQPCAPTNFFNKLSYLDWKRKEKKTPKKPKDIDNLLRSWGKTNIAPLFLLKHENTLWETIRPKSHGDKNRAERQKPQYTARVPIVQAVNTGRAGNAGGNAPTHTAVVPWPLRFVIMGLSCYLGVP